MKTAWAATLTILGSLSAFVSAEDADPKPKGYWERAKEAFEQLDRKRTTEEIQRLYQQAKAAGETVPADVLEWAREDLGRAGRWEYRVAQLEGEPEEIEAQLNALGRERWECFTLTRDKKKWSAVLKRPATSRIHHYLGYVSATDVLRLLGGNEK
jgi:hypothetical protein